MKVEIYIKNKQIDLYEGINYSITKQVNDFTELVTRQWDYTNKWKVPKTAHNKKVFDFLSYAGNTSDIPYIKIDGSQLYFNGVPVIPNGYAEIEPTDDDYNIVMYSGAVNFYDAIKDLTLQNLDWSDLDHEYGETTMEDSFGNTEGVIYPISIVSESQPFTDTWLDMPSPSVYLSNILDKISSISGVTILGDILTDPIFLKKVMTTEFSVKLPTDSTILVGTDTGGANVNSGITFNGSDVAEINTTLGHYLVKMQTTRWGAATSSFTLKVDGNSKTTVVLSEDTLTNEYYVYGSDFSVDLDVNNQSADVVQASVVLTVSRINFGTVPVRFSELMPKMGLSTWMRDLLVSFGLNIYPSNDGTSLELNYINNYAQAEVVDISKYLSKNNGEDYVYGSYSNKNNFKYAVADDQEDYSFGQLTLSQNKGGVSDHYISPFNQPIIAAGSIYYNILFNSNKEPISAKIKTFTIDRTGGNVELHISDGLNGKTVSQPAIYVFDDIQFSKIIPRYYGFIQERVFRRPVRKKLSMQMPMIRFYNIDFQKLYYVSQLGKNYIISKATYNSRGAMELNVIEVEPKTGDLTVPNAIITGQTSFNQPVSATVSLDGSDSFSAGGYITDYLWSVTDGGTEIYTSDKATIIFDIPESEFYTVCLTVTNNQGLTNQRCDSVINQYAEVVEDIFNNIDILLTNDCYTYAQFKITHDPNTTFELRIRGGVSSGEGHIIVWDANNSDGVVCQGLCPELGQMTLPKLGPGVNEITYTDDLILQVPLDNNGEALIQLRCTGAKNPSAPTSNYFGITAWHDASGYNKNIVLRSWNRTTLC